MLKVGLIWQLTASSSALLGVALWRELSGRRQG
jgi:hypothetical protein